MQEENSKNNISKVVTDLQNVGCSLQFTNVFNTTKNSTPRDSQQNLLVDTKYPVDDKSEMRNVQSSSSLYTSGISRNEYIEDFCMLKNTFAARKNVLKHATHKNVASTNTQKLLLTTKAVSSKPKIHRNNVFTQIDVIEKPIKNYKTENQNEIRREEKMTYCRPVTDKYTQEFVNQAIERNVKLKYLVKRLVLARQKEKQNESWNNYINELKNKHAYYDPCRGNVEALIEQNESKNIIEDYNNESRRERESRVQQSDLYEQYYNDNKMFSGACPDEPNIMFRRDNVGYIRDLNNLTTNSSIYKYQNNSFCFPTSSQGRLIIQNREQNGKQFNHQLKKCYRDRTTQGYGSLVKDKNIETIRSKYYYKLCDVNTSLRTSTAQTECIDLSNNNLSKDHSNKIYENTKQVSLANIEFKLNVLIQSINTFINEVKIKDLHHKSVAVTNSIDKIQNITKVYNIEKIMKNVNSDIKKNSEPRKEIACGMPLYSKSNSKPNDTIDDILKEEMHKSDKVKRDIEEILTKNDDQCVQITFDIPTKEHATEVTESFYSSFNTVLEDVGREQSKGCMTIAVNTDPLGFLALMRVSAEAVKQILSYVPNIDYLSYLARLQAPRIQSAREASPESRYLCNICGASFSEPSRLSDHIQRHNLGNMRDCCVCRHVMDLKRHRSGLFQCQYCGQVFTRAYCRQLHEQGCPKKVGQEPRDVTPAELLLLS